MCRRALILAAALGLCAAAGLLLLASDWIHHGSPYHARQVARRAVQEKLEVPPFTPDTERVWRLQQNGWAAEGSLNGLPYHVFLQYEPRTRTYRVLSVAAADRLRFSPAPGRAAPPHPNRSQ